MPEGVVGCQNPAWDQIGFCPIQIGRVTVLLSIDKDKTKGSFCFELGQQAVGVADPDLYLIGYAGQRP